MAQEQNKCACLLADLGWITCKHKYTRRSKIQIYIYIFFFETTHWIYWDIAHLTGLEHTTHVDPCSGILSQVAFHPQKYGHSSFASSFAKARTNPRAAGSAPTHGEAGATWSMVLRRGDQRIKKSPPERTWSLSCLLDKSKSDSKGNDEPCSRWNNFPVPPPLIASSGAHFI